MQEETPTIVPPDTTTPNVPEHKTMSLLGAAYCMTCGVRLLRVEPAVPGNANFVLDNTGNATNKSLQDWWEGNPTVPAKTLLGHRSTLIRLAHQAERTQSSVAFEGVQA